MPPVKPRPKPVIPNEQERFAPRPGETQETPVDQVAQSPIDTAIAQALGQYQPASYEEDMTEQPREQAQPVVPPDEQNPIIASILSALQGLAYPTDPVVGQQAEDRTNTFLNQHKQHMNRSLAETQRIKEKYNIVPMNNDEAFGPPNYEGYNQGKAPSQVPYLDQQIVRGQKADPAIVQQMMRRKMEQQNASQR